MVTIEVERLGNSLQGARQRLGMSQEAVAQATGINRVVLSYYESGSRIPSLPVVASLARLYGLTVTDLMEGAEPTAAVDIDTSTVLFRSSALREHSESAILAFSSYIRAYVRLLKETGQEIPGKGQTPFEPVPTRAPRKQAARLARELRRYLGLGSGPIGNLFSLADDYLLIFRLPLGDLDRGPSGFFYNHPEAGFCVIVNSNMDHGRQLFTLAHEIGHAYFHSKETDWVVSGPSGVQGHEVFANAFASEFLVPADSLARAMDESDLWNKLEDPASVIHLQQYFSVSYHFTVIRLYQEGLIDEALFERLKVVSPIRLARALGYPVAPFETIDGLADPLERFPYRMLRLVRKAVADGVISRGAAGEMLGVSLHDILELEAEPEVTDKAARNRLLQMERAVLGADQSHGTPKKR